MDAFYFVGGKSNGNLLHPIQIRQLIGQFPQSLLVNPYRCLRFVTGFIEVLFGS